MKLAAILHDYRFLIAILSIYALLIFLVLDTKPVVETESAAEVRRFIKDCHGSTLVTEADGVYQLRCKK